MTLPARIAIDSNCFVYLQDTDSARGSFVDREIVHQLVSGARTAVASTIALAELLVRPFRDGDVAAALELRASIEGLPGLDVIAVDSDVAERAARVRAAHGLRLPDAIHVATAIVGRADAILTNDRVIVRSAPLIDVLVLDDLIELPS